MREVFLCAIDATPASVPGLRCALRLAKASAARLILLHVVETPDKRRGWYVPTSPAERKAYQGLLDRQMLAIHQRLQQLLLECDARRTGVTVEVVVRPGGVVQTLAEVARARDASLIVVGRGRKPGPLAPTAEQIVRAISRPILLVPRKWIRGAQLRIVRTPAKRRRSVARAS